MRYMCVYNVSVELFRWVLDWYGRTGKGQRRSTGWPVYSPADYLEHKLFPRPILECQNHALICAAWITCD